MAMPEVSSGVGRPTASLGSDQIFEPIDYLPRVGSVRDALVDRFGLDAVLATDPVTLRWMTGFTGSTGWLVITTTRAVLGVDARYVERAADELSRAGLTDRVEIYESQQGASRHSEVKSVMGEIARCGARAGALSHAEWSSFAAVVDLVAIDGLFEDLRRSKDPGEVARMAHAAQIASGALMDAMDLIDVGTTEMEMRIELEYRMRRRGADDAAYPTIVASGPQHSARPHHDAGGRPFEDGDLVVIDIGAAVDGYRSDMTRTFLIGERRPPLMQRYELVLAAQSAGLVAVVAGAQCSAVDRACREVVAEAGLEDEYLHIAGHGVGLEIHELPFHSPRSGDQLRVGDVVTVEPGVYRVGVGGIRIEDLVVVTEHGYLPLTSFPKDSPCLPLRPMT